MNDETKLCPYCNAEIKAEAMKCRFCGKWLCNNENENNKEINNINCIDTTNNQNIKVNIHINIEHIKKVITIILSILIAILIFWVLLGDYPAASRNHENFWYGQYLLSGILHVLLAIICLQFLIIIKK